MGSGLHFEKDGDAIVRNTIVLENGSGSGYEISIVDAKPVFSYCDVPDKIAGKGNIHTEPYFRNPGKENYYLMSIACGDSLDSPCIDSGDPKIEDINMGCDSGLGNSRSDMGAYGGYGGNIVKYHEKTSIKQFGKGADGY